MNIVKYNDEFERLNEVIVRVMMGFCVIIFIIIIQCF